MQTEVEDKRLNNRREINMIWFIIAACGIVLDQLAKLWAYRNLAGGTVRQIIPDFLSFRYHVNTGAAWSFLADHSWGIYLLSFISFLACILFVVGIIRIQDRRIRFCLSLILAGAAGNLIDRILRRGVIDFVSFTFGSYHFPVFNLADMFLVIGLILVILFLLFTDSKSLLNSREKR